MKTFFLQFGLVTAYLMIALALAGVPLLIILSNFTPKILLDKYLREPHYNIFEQAWYSVGLGKFMRTIQFAGAISWPWLVKKRKLGDMRYYAPWWFKWTSYVICWALLLPSVFGLTISSVLLPFID